MTPFRTVCGVFSSTGILKYDIIKVIFLFLTASAFEAFLKKAHPEAHKA